MEPSQSESVDPPTEASASSSSRKKRRTDRDSHTRVLTTRTVTSPWTYVHLVLTPVSEVSSKPSIPASSHKVLLLDEITALSHINSALGRFLGITGTAMDVAVLRCGRRGGSHDVGEDGSKVSGAQASNECWVRVPREDSSAFMAAMGGWSGTIPTMMELPRNHRDWNQAAAMNQGGEVTVAWRVKGSAPWLGNLLGKRDVEALWE